MDPIRQKLVAAEEKAAALFKETETRGLLTAGKSERELNEEVFRLADELFGIKKYWHKRIVRSGPNTLQPYDENPPNRVLGDDDILFFDFGPIFEDYEADFGRTYVIGNDPLKHKLRQDIESAWQEAKAWYDQQTALTGAELYRYVVEMAKRYGWRHEAEIAGHLIGQFPHERLESENNGLYIHPENNNDMFLPDAQGNKRNWILEIHFIDRDRQIGGFFEQLLT